MRNWIHQLISPQTTALETVTFIVVVAVLCTLCAVAFYSLIMILLRRLRWPTKTLEQVFLPGPERRREMLWEYGLAFVTSVVLTLTLVQKKEIVDTVLAFPVAEIGTGNAHALASLLPLHAPPNAAELGPDSGSLAGVRQIFNGQRSAEYAAVRTLALVRPVLEQGRTEAVEALFRLIVPEAIRRSKGVVHYARIVLMCAAVLLVFGNLARLVSARARDLAKDSADASPQYADTLRGLFGAGVALALLLASPLTVTDPTGIAQSAVRAAHDDPLTPSEIQLGRAVSNVIDVQLHLQRNLRILGDTALGSLSRVVARLDRAAAELQKDVDRSREEQTAWRAEMDREMADLKGSMVALGSSVAGLRAATRDTTELVIVQAPTRATSFTIALASAPRTPVVTATGFGIVRLPPGKYQLMMGRVATPFTLALGAPLAFWLDSPGRTVIGSTLGPAGVKIP